MKPFLHIFANLNVLAFLFFSSPINSAEYLISNNREWLDVANFKTDVVNQKNHQTHSVKFNAISLEEFDVEISHNFPRLNPKDAQSCGQFKRDVANWVAHHLKIKEYQFQYRARLPQGQLRIKVKPPQMQQLNPRLADVALKFDRETCKMSLGRLQVIIDMPGVVGKFVVDVLDSQLSEWTSDAVSYTELNAKEASVISVNKRGEVFTAAGHRRSCTLPCVADVQGFTNEHVETFAYYVPTPKKYKEAIASTVLPEHKPDATQGEICYLEPNSDDDCSHNYSEDPSISVYSVQEDDDDYGGSVPSDPYKFFEITGPEQKIPAEKNPFLWLKRDRSCHYTKASQVPCCPIKNGVLDVTSPHILQLIEETGITTGETHGWATDEFGLRWPILDDNKQPISPTSCKVQRLSRHCACSDLRDMNMPEGQHANEIYQFQDRQSLDDFPLVYNGALNNNHAALDFTKTYAHTQAYLYDKMKIHTLPITSLDVESSPDGRRCPTQFDMRKFPKITKLRLNIGWETSYYSVFTICASKMPMGNVTDIAVVYDDDYRFSFDCCSRERPLDRELQFRSVSIKGGCVYNYSFIYHLAEFIKQNPKLEELYIDVRFPDKNDPHNRWFDGPYDYSNPGYSLGNLKPALEKSRLKKLVFVEHGPNNHAEYSRLIFMLKEYAGKFVQFKKP